NPVEPREDSVLILNDPAPNSCEAYRPGPAGRDPPPRRRNTGRFALHSYRARREASVRFPAAASVVSSPADGGRWPRALKGFDACARVPRLGCSSTTAAGDHGRSTVISQPAALVG